jgi:MerR family transcriptional regulator, light-induced transcriptional regulator
MPSLHANRSASGGRVQRLATRLIAPPKGGRADEPTGTAASRSGDCIDVLTRMVEGEIIPRLLLAHQQEHPPASTLSPLGPEAVEDFARQVLHKDSSVLVAHVAALLDRGTPLQSIYIDLLAPAARKLGDFWTSDECSFADVTVGLGKLQFLLHDLGRRDAKAHQGGQGRSVLLVTPPGEQHTFGLVVVEELFRRAGWRTWSESCGDPEEISRLVAGQWFDLFGVSVSTEANLDAAAAVIASVRKSSRNRMVRVIVGGPVFMENPGLSQDVGADAVASGSNDPVAVAEQVVAQLEGRG